MDENERRARAIRDVATLERYAATDFGEGTSAGPDASSFWEAQEDPSRFLLVEIGSEQTGERRWYTTHRSPQDAARYHTGQDYAEEWTAALLLDLDTRETITMRHFERWEEAARRPLDLNDDNAGSGRLVIWTEAEPEAGCCGNASTCPICQEDDEGIDNFARAEYRTLALRLVHKLAEAHEDDVYRGHEGDDSGTCSYCQVIEEAESLLGLDNGTAPSSAEHASGRPEGA